MNQRFYEQRINEKVPRSCRTRSGLRSTTALREYKTEITAQVIGDLCADYTLDYLYGLLMIGTTIFVVSTLFTVFTLERLFTLLYILRFFIGITFCPSCRGHQTTSSVRSTAGGGPFSTVISS